MITRLPLYADDQRLNEILSQFEVYAEEQRKAWNIPGLAIGIIKDQNVLLAKGYGQRGLSDKRPVDENTIFQTGSLSKAFTAALVAIAADKKWLKWEDSVIQHMPTFRLSDPWVTTQFQMIDLLAQRSGLPPYAGDGQAFLGFTRDEMLNHLQYIHPLSSFRSQFAYQNILFLVAAHILEKKAKMTYEELLKQEIFLPLEMTNSTVTLKDYLEAPNRAEWLMRLEDGSTTRLNDDFPYNNWNYILGPAGGINSNVADLSKWLILQANLGKFKNKQLITENNMKQMTRPMVFVGDGHGSAMYYALGWVRTDYSPYPIIWHNGSTLGAFNVAAFIPEEKMGIVVLSNVRNTNLALALVLQFFDLYFGKPYQDWSQQLLAEQKNQVSTPQQRPSTPYSPLTLAKYAGTYQNPIYGDAIVEEKDQQLAILIGKNHLRLHMKPWDRDIFSLIWPIAQDSESRVIFIPDEKGNITTMRIEIFTKEGAGDFKKI